MEEVLSGSSPVHCRCHILALIAAGAQGMPSLEETEAPSFRQDVLLFALVLQREETTKEANKV